MNPCTYNLCGSYPLYGVAPHECYFRKPGGAAKNPLGTSTIEPLEKWPGDFLAEIDRNAPIKEQLAYGLAGVWYCPKCKRGMKETDTLLGPEKIRELIKNEH